MIKAVLTGVTILAVTLYGIQLMTGYYDTNKGLLKAGYTDANGNPIKYTKQYYDSLR